MKKRLLAFLLAAAMVVSMLPSVTFATEEPAITMDNIITAMGETHFVASNLVEPFYNADVYVVKDNKFIMSVANGKMNLEAKWEGDIKIIDNHAECSATTTVPGAELGQANDVDLPFTALFYPNEGLTAVTKIIIDFPEEAGLKDFTLLPYVELESVDGIVNVTYPEDKIVDGEVADYALEFRLNDGISPDQLKETLTSLYGKHLFIGSFEYGVEYLLYFVCDDKDVEYYSGIAAENNGIVPLDPSDINNDEYAEHRAYLLSMNYRVTPVGVGFTDFSYRARLYWREFYNQPGRFGMAPWALYGEYNTVDFEESSLKFTPMQQGNSYLPYAWDQGEKNDYCPILADFVNDNPYAIGVTYKDGVDKDKLGSMTIDLLLEARNQYGLAPITNNQVVLATGEFKMGKEPEKEPEVEVTPVSEEEKAEIEKQVAEDVVKDLPEGTTVTEEQKNAAKEAAAEAVEKIIENKNVAAATTNVAEAVKTDETTLNNIIAKAAQQAEEKQPGSGSDFTGGTNVDTKTKVEVKLETVKVDAQSVVSAQAIENITVNTAVYDVMPIANVTTTITEAGKDPVVKTETVILKNEDLNGNPVTVRLGVPSTNAKKAKVTHTSEGYPDEIIYADIQGTSPSQYVEIQMNHFSTVEVQVLDGEVTNPVAAIGTTGYATLAQALTAANSGDTIELLADLSDLGSVNLPAGVTLDGNSHKISGNSAVYVNAAGGTVQNVVFENIQGNNLSAIYASGLTGTAVITGCTFDNVDWDAIQSTPVAGATVTITGNTFRHTAEGTAKRYVHVESAMNVDFTATVTGNKFYDCDKFTGTNTALEVYYPSNPDKLDCSHNYIDNCAVYLSTGKSMNNAFAKALPLMDETLTNELDIVAHCGKKFYTSFDDAFAAMNAANGATITLFKDVTVDSTKVVDIGEYQYCTINLNGHNITGGNNRVFQVKAGKLSLNGNGTISSNPAQSSSVIRVGDNNANINSQLTVNSGVTVSTATAYGISAFGAKTETVNVYGTVTSTAPANNAYDGCAIATLGTDTTPAKITISAGATVSATNTNAVYLPAGNLIVQGDATTITGATGIYVKGGSAAIKGGTITGNGEQKAYQYYGNGGISTGDALVIDNCGYPTEISSVAITGGTFVSQNGKQVGAYYGNTKTEIANITSTNNNLTVPEGYKWDDTGKLVKCEYVAQIGDVKYETLAQAFAAANNLGTAEIDMIADTTFSFDNATYATVNKNSNITLDLNGKTIISTGTYGKSSELIRNLGTLTIKDSAEKVDDHFAGKIIHGANPAWVYDGSGSYNGSYASNLILNYGGTVIIEGGHLENASLAGQTGSAAYVVDNNNNEATGITSLVVNDGEIVAAWTAIRQFVQQSQSDKQNNVTVNGGSISAKRNCFMMNASALNIANLTINGGIFTTAKEGNSGTSAPIQLWQANTSTTKMSVNVKGGCFKAEGGATQKIVELDFTEATTGEAKKAIQIEAGFFNLNNESLTDYVVEGKTVIDTPAGDERTAGYIYMIGIAPVAPAVDPAAESGSKADVPTGAQEGLAEKVVKEVLSEITGNTAVSGAGSTNIQSTEVENKLKQQITGLVDSTSQLKITVKSVATSTSVTTIGAIQASTITTTSAKYDVKPWVTIETTDDQGVKTTETRVISNEELAAAKVSITFRLAVPASMKSNEVLVKHYPNDTGTGNPDWSKMYVVQGSGANRYVELESNSFSVYALEDYATQGYVALIKETNTPYTTLSAALSAATSVSGAQTIIVLKDINEPATFIALFNDTLDLNGHTVVALGAAMFGGQIFDTYETGLLKIDKANIAFNTDEVEEATVLPVWDESDTAAKGYRFFKQGIVYDQFTYGLWSQELSSERDGAKVNLWFNLEKPGNWTKAVAGIKIGVNINYKVRGKDANAVFEFSQATLNTYAANAVSKQNTSTIYLKFINTGSISEITVVPYIKAANDGSWTVTAPNGYTTTK